ncbi:MAG: DUF5693 family protein [Thermaceae bacterium]|nr:DUF5693 family protein [Thermaceae bacterium]
MNLNLLRIAVLLAALVCIPALLPRMKAERPGPVILMMDGEAVSDEARTEGKSLEALLQEYKAQGVGGVALYERSVRGLVDKGRIIYQSAANLKLIYPVAPVKPGWYYLTGPTALLDQLAAEWDVPTERITIGTQTWLGAPLDVGGFPAGFDPDLFRQLKAQGFYLAARPLNSPNRRFEAPLVPPETDVVIFGGTEVLGFPDPETIEKVATRLEGKPVAMIESTNQRGFDLISKYLPVLRLFSIKADWQDKLTPPEVTDKFVLAARERGHQILYLRPFRTAQDTREFLSLLTNDLGRSHIPIGTPMPRNFHPSPLRYVAWIGIAAGVVLLALGLPAPFGIPVAILLTLFALGYARSESGPLLAAMVFPVLGFLERPRLLAPAVLGIAGGRSAPLQPAAVTPVPGMGLWLAAVLYAFAGVIFLAALGSTPQSVLGLQPFKGVSLTLIVPPLLVALSFLPRDFKGALNTLYAHPLRLGEVALAIFGLALVALALLRRGNDAAGSIVPSWELQLRAFLQDIMVRPRFKEIFAHALAPIALLLPWPTWIRNSLLLLVSVGIASILNTFSHYHTPLTISFFRVLNGIVIGLIVGFIGLAIVRRVRRWWLE